MVGVSMIGDSRRKGNSTNYFSAEARSLCRLLGLLKDPRVASEALLASLDRHAGIREMIQDVVQDAANSSLNDSKTAEYRMSLALGYAIEHGNDESRSGAALSKSTDPDGNKKKKTKTTSRNVSTDVTDNDSIEPTTTGPPTTTKLRSAAVVSDSSSGVSDEEEEVVKASCSQAAMFRSRHIKTCWAQVLESLHLQVTSRTNRVWGRKKMWEIYQLGSPAKEAFHVEQIRTTVEQEFRSIFHGGTDDTCGCRTYSLLRDDGKQLYIQLNIGKFYDLQDESNRSLCGEKKKKKCNEYVALVEPGSSLMAVTASRAPSAPYAERHTKYVLTALEAALVAGSTRRHNSNQVDDSLVPKRFGDWAGNEPVALLRDAQNSQAGQAVGRFAKLARDNLSSNPLMQLHAVSTESLVDRTQEQARLAVSSQHGRHVAQLQKEQMALVATNARGVLVDGSAQQHASRKRARDDALGDEGDCPKWQRVAWKWTGKTRAAAAAKEEESSDLEFKCGVVMEGSNVFEGLRTLMAAGFTKRTLPDYVRDAPTMKSSTITVDHGEYGGTESFAAV